MIRKALTFVLLLGQAAVFFTAVWLVHGLYRPLRLRPESALFEAPKGSRVAGVATRLRREGRLERSGPFLAAYRLFIAPRPVIAGEYEWKDPLTVKRALLDLVEGRVHLRSFTVPEGLTARETASLLDAKGVAAAAEFLAAARAGAAVADLDPTAPNLEGYLYPDTYFYPKGAAAAEIVKAMVARFRAVFDPGFQARARLGGMTIRQAVTLASLIEKEASLPAEKRLVSAVFHNRLRIGMKLDCDPTVIYGLKEAGRFDGNLRRRDLETPGPYNSYLRPGLPPGPICNPGREALEAALDPADAPYLYFVSRNDGSHVFSATFREHQNAVRAYQLNRAAREAGRARRPHSRQRP
jgi:UPF0755 protein